MGARGKQPPESSKDESRAQAKPGKGPSGGRASKAKAKAKPKSSQKRRVSVDPARLELMNQVVEAAGDLCDALGRAAWPSAPEVSLVSPPRIASERGVTSLKEFLEGVKDLRARECEKIAEAAEQTLEQVYVHLPLKRAMHAVDPIQRLKLLRRRIAERSVAAFHAEMIAIFHSLRDLHTAYALPDPYQGVVAFLPFLVEKFYEDQGENKARYVVSKVCDGFDHPDFGVGVRVTHWNGIPIGRAVELVADREAGGNPDAREARGLEALTIRPLGLSAAPDEEWVVVGYEHRGRALEVRFEWMVFSPPVSPSGIAIEGQAQGVEGWIGVDAKTEEVRRAKKALFFPEKVGIGRRMADPPVSERIAIATDGLPRAEPGPPLESVLGGESGNFREGVSASDSETSGNHSSIPDVFEFRRVPGPRGDLGYIRIYSFMAETDAFVEEFVRIAHLLPSSGLILDVRGNGGGNILAGERLLQLLTPREIEPARFQFLNTPTMFELCRESPLGLDLGRWVDSIGLAADSGEVYSQGFPLQSREDANRIGQRYQGPVVLITDALCYSTTDIFAAGFQDHGIGKILGTSRCTGAGGANVWSYDLLQRALPRHFKPLPGNAGFRVAARRSTRVGERSGLPVEDFGVRADKVYWMTETDVLGRNEALIRCASELIDGQTRYSLLAEVDWSHPPASVLRVETENVTRIDLYQDGRPIGSYPTEESSTGVMIPDEVDPARPLVVRGFEGGQLVVSTTVAPGPGGAG